MVDPVVAAREAFVRRAWAEAYGLLQEAPSLQPEDLERLAVAAQLLGRTDESDRAWERAHTAAAEAGDHATATRCAFWLGIDLLLRGEEARAGGWFARAERVVQPLEAGCAARGFLLLPGFLQAVGSGDAARAADLSQQMVETGERCGDRDLLALGLLGLGQAALALGDLAGGMRSLDEVMVAVTTGEVSPIPAGIVYCAVLEACVDTFDVRRATAWTDEFHSWCAAQPDLVPYRGQCLVHRAELLQAHGGWADAAVEAERARRSLAELTHPAVGLALYQQGELHRLRGELDEAKVAYRAANEAGREPTPGLQLLRLAEGSAASAATAIRRALREGGRPDHPRVLAAAVEILLAAGDDAGARAAADELAAIARERGVPLLDAIAAYAAGGVLLREGDAEGAVSELRRARGAWLELSMGYDVARARARLAEALDAVGDLDAAAIERESARATFEGLGARPDLAALPRGSAPAGSSRLSGRELEVLRLVAAGQSNREIAEHLTISQHTVARHVQNIFAKLGVSSRSAATAHAFEHGLV